MQPVSNWTSPRSAKSALGTTGRATEAFSAYRTNRPAQVELE